MPVITSFYAAILTLIYTVLMLRVVQARWTQKVGLGSGDSKHLMKRIRIHANFAENVPLTLILLYLCEVQNIMSGMYLNVLGVFLVISRLLHAIGISQSVGTSFGRSAGSLINQVVNLVLAGALIFNYLNH